MDIEKKLTNLSLFYDKEEYLLLTAAQTQKDLVQFDLTFDIGDRQINFNTMLSALTPIILDLLQNHREKIVQLFYRIDVDESNIANALELESTNESAEEISKIILHRELKKVIIRKHYSSR